MKTAPTFVRAGQPGGQPFAVSTYDVGRRDRMIRADVDPDIALDASGIPPGHGRVIVRVEALNKILASSRLSATELAEILNS